MPIHTLTPRYPRLGRITCGYQKKGISKRTKQEVVYPARSSTLVIHSSDRDALEAWAKVVGGTIAISPTSTEDAEKYFLVSQASSIPVRLPTTPKDPRVLSQWMEAWSTTGLVRKCDGIDCLLRRLPPAQGQTVGDLTDEVVPCVCIAEDLADDDRCKPVVRLAVLPAAPGLVAGIRGIGVWMVQSGGWGSNSELASDLDLLENVIGAVGPGVPLVLRVVQRKSKHGDVPMLKLELDATPAEARALAGVKRFADLPSHETPAIDAAQSDGAVGTFVGPPTEDDVVDADFEDVEPDAADGETDRTTAPPDAPATPAPVTTAPASGPTFSKGRGRQMRRDTPHPADTEEAPPDDEDVPPDVAELVRAREELGALAAQHDLSDELLAGVAGTHYDNRDFKHLDLANTCDLVSRIRKHFGRLPTTPADQPAATQESLV